MDNSLSDIASSLEISQPAQLPVIAAFCRQIGIDAIINRLVPTEMDLDAGTVVIGMILDTLCGRSPLYQLHQFFRGQDTELLFGIPLAATAFNDDAVGRVLDRLHGVGTMKIFTEISLQACKRFQVQTHCGNFDTTSVNVWGNYDCSTPEGNAPHVTYGHSKDKRGDLKQFMISLLCVEGNIPLAGNVQDGNAADTQLNNEELQRLSSLIRETGQQREDFLYVADCKLVTKANLQILGDDPFITRLPANYNAHQDAIDRALAEAEDKWQSIGPLNQTPSSAKRPAAEYKVNEQSIKLYGKSYRAIVVHSSNHDKRRCKRIDRQLKTAKGKTEKVCKASSKERYQCRADAEVALQKLEESHEDQLWLVSGEIEEITKHGQGRPPKNRPHPVVSVSYRLKLESKENTEKIAKLKERAGCFVLLTNTKGTPQETGRSYTAGEVLEEYKGQHGVERNFSIIKDPLIVNDVFLKKPERINALGMVLLLSLLVWSLMERTMRRNQGELKLELKNLDNKATARPTTHIMLRKFRGIMVMRRGSERRLTKNIGYEQNQYLMALGLTGKIFTTPPPAPYRRY
jgi:transposase